MMLVYGIAPTAAVALAARSCSRSTSCSRSPSRTPRRSSACGSASSAPFLISFVRTLFFLAPGLVPLAAVGGRRVRTAPAEPADRAVRGVPGGAAGRPPSRGVGAALPDRDRARCCSRCSLPVYRREAAALREGRMSARLRHGDGLGVRFQFDRQNRVVSPLLAKLRRRGDETLGAPRRHVLGRAGRRRWRSSGRAGRGRRRSCA